jgi:aminopeptidase N
LRSTRFSLLCLLGLGLLIPVGAGAAQREPFFPSAGSSAFDALHYDVELAYQPGKGGRIQATTKIVAVAKRRISDFKLDFAGPRVLQVRVNGKVAGRDRTARKLHVFLVDQVVPKGDSFRITVHYAGMPPKLTDPDGSQEGWFRTDDGVIAVGEPQGTATWIPCNNIPTDKATFEFHITIPDSLKAVANGRREQGANRDRAVQMNWAEDAPMSTYLAVLNIGRGRIVKSRAGGLPTWTLVDPRLERGSRGPLAELPEVIRFEAAAFGAYAFDSAGSLVDYAPSLGYALESQSRPIYAYVPDVTTIVHETAHQWFGDSVGLERWPQIWLNEGFATWAQWYYAERHGGRSTQAIFRRLQGVPAANEAFWNPAPGRLGDPKQLFDPTTYVRGAMALQALRQEIGTQPFLRVLRRWTSEHRHANATIGQFEALAEEVSGRPLDGLFQRWLYQRGKPR